MAISYVSILDRIQEIVWQRKGNGQTSNPFPPFPITPFNPLTNAPVRPSSCSMLLCQSSWPVHKTTCSEYAAIVLRSGVSRSMSRSGGVEAQAHVGDGHVAVVGIVLWRSVRVVDKCRKLRMQGAGVRDRRANVYNMVSCCCG